MTKIRKISIYNDHYDCHIVYLIGKDVHWLKKYIARKHGDIQLYSWASTFKFGEDANTTNGYQFHVNAPLGDGEMFYVWVAEPTPYLLVHETIHLTDDILYTRGIGYTYSSEEAYAYLGGWIFEKVFKRLGGKLPKK
jgi:hypothetical protein